MDIRLVVALVGLVGVVLGFFLRGFYEDKLKFQQAKKTKDAAQERINQIEIELREVDEYRNNDKKFLQLLAEQSRKNDWFNSLKTLFLLIAFLAITIAGYIDSFSSANPVRTLFVALFMAGVIILFFDFLFSILKRDMNPERILRNISNFETYKAKLEKERKDLEETIKWFSKS